MNEGEGAMEFDMDAPLAQALKRKRKLSQKKKQTDERTRKPLEAACDPESAQLPSVDEHLTTDASLEIAVSEFDYSVENHFKAVDTIAELCGHPTTLDANQPEIKRFSNSVIFLREWRDFHYAPRIVRFACQRDPEEKDVIGGVTLSQFSAAAVPKKESHCGSRAREEPSKDFVMHVGGAVWALDWCARVDHNSENHIKSEFVAVAAHPPESSYHKIGAPLTGRGAIQIWCLLTSYEKEDVLSHGNKKSRPYSKKDGARPRGRPRKHPPNDPVERIDTESQYVQPVEKISKPLAIEYPIGSPGSHSSNRTVKSNEVTKLRRPRGRPRKQPLSDPVEKRDTDSQKSQPLAIDYPMSPPGLHSSDRTGKSNKVTKLPRPRGRPRKKPLNDSVEKIDTESQNVQLLAIEYSMGPPGSESSDRTSENARQHSHHEESVRTNKDSNQTEHANALVLTAPEGIEDKEKSGKNGQVQNNRLHSLRKCENGKSALMNPLASASLNLDSMSLDRNRINIDSCDSNNSWKSIPVDVALPRMMLCLAHNGKVAWDVKWRPVNDCDPESMTMMGYLAVLLGNGALEVWQVPLPHTVKLVHPANQEHTDPRFLKLQPVFRCSMLNCGDRQSIPLTVEWSVSSPHDMILTGCHDGVVALWKFSVTDSLTETKPLLSFNADTGPIRTLAWAPQSDLECANVILTGGHKGFKFWDIRDPFRPLWDQNIPAVTYDLDWLREPRCVFGCTEDGILWLISLEKPTHDIPIAGKCITVPPKQAHSFDCSTFSLWSVKASKLTGMVAYCGEDGTTFCFQPTSRSVRDPSRNRTDHHLCGSLLEDKSGLIVATPLTNSLFSKRSPNMKRAGSGKEQEKKAKENTGGETINECEKKEKIEVFPPKSVAMHRVKWNVNKGSEKWLCYGGAAGLLRCQDIDFSRLQ